MPRTEITVVGYGELSRALHIPIEQAIAVHTRGYLNHVCKTAAGEFVFDVNAARRALAARPAAQPAPTPSVNTMHGKVITAPAPRSVTPGIRAVQPVTKSAAARPPTPDRKPDARYSKPTIRTLTVGTRKA